MELELEKLCVCVCVFARTRRTAPSSGRNLQNQFQQVGLDLSFVLQVE